MIEKNNDREYMQNFVVRAMKLEIDHDIHFDGDVRTIELEIDHEGH